MAVTHKILILRPIKLFYTANLFCLLRLVRGGAAR